MKSNIKADDKNSIWNKIEQRIFDKSQHNRFIKEDEINIIIKEEINKSKEEYRKTYHSEWNIF